MNAEMSEAAVEPIAIVGMSCRFPGARTPEEYWKGILHGTESIRGHSREELASAGVDASVLNHPNFVSAHGAIDEVDRFDADLFEFSARESEGVDPQHRLFLECAWEALENAGYDPAQYPGSIGIYAGSGASDYLLKNIMASREARKSLSGFEIFIGNDKDFLPTRTSYKLDLTGPSMAINTACSSSLVAAHTACQALQNYDCDIALAGGVKLHLPLVQAYVYQEGMILSPDGHCRPFDADAAGTVSGSGVGLVVLKRLEEALKDGDCIQAVICGGAINNDGRNKVGYTAPSAEGQARVLSEAYQLAGVDPSSIGYVEAHGTGTRFGDPVEVAALTRVYRRYTQAQQYCALGSVKANIGHLDTAAGVAGLIKAVLVLRNRTIPPGINWSRPNPELQLDSSPFFIPTEASPWRMEDGQGPRRAAVSSFGIGGTNAHLILEEAPQATPPRTARGPQLLVWSGKDKAACDSLRSRYSAHLQQYPATDLADMAHTLAVGRKALPRRCALVCADTADAHARLSEPQASGLIHGLAERRRNVVFLFPGQGTETLRMGARLYAQDPVFAGHLKRCLDLLRTRYGLDLGPCLLAQQPDAAATAQIHNTRYAQPALFCIEHALASTLLDLGVKPAALLGHSLGEYTAVCIAGVMSLEQALQLVVTRSELMAGLPPGQMLAVSADEAKLHPLLPAELSIAALNSPKNTVVSGPTSAMSAFAAELRARKIPCKLVNASYAFHSAMTEPLMRDLEAAAARLDLQPPSLPILSNLSGCHTATNHAKADYWASHMRGTVRFRDCIEALREDPDHLYVEVGPGQTLSTLARQCGIQAEALIPLLPQPEQDGKSALLSALGRLWVQGGELSWKPLYADQGARRINLPTYPFRRERYWIEPDTSAEPSPAPAAGETIERRPLRHWFYRPRWRPAAAGAAENAQKPRFVLFSEDPALLELATTGLAPYAQSVQQYSLAGDGTKLDRNAPEAFDALLEQSQAEVVVYCWPHAAADPAGATVALTRLVHLSQSLTRIATQRPISLSLLVCNAFPVRDGELAVPESALPMGVVQVLPKELPQLDCRIIDLDRRELSGPHRPYLAAALGRELSVPATEVLVALRGIDRWVRDFEPMELSALPPQWEAEQFEDKTLVLTGGMGGIGRTLASALAGARGIRLALIGHRDLPQRGVWQQWIATHHQEDRTSILLQALMDLEARGTRVLLLQADVADPAQMHEVRRRIEQEFGRIDFLLHAAGVPAGGLISLKQDAQIARVLRPKVAGTAVLAEVFGDARIDNVVLFSSITALSGWVGQVDYTAANAYLDAAAAAGWFPGARRTLAINWDAWAEVGMAAHTPRLGVTALPTVAENRLNHPLFRSRRSDGTGRTIFSADLSPQTHWVLSEHRILGIPTVPGTFHIEALRAAFALDSAAPGVHFRELTFNQPMMVADDQNTCLEIELSEARGGWDFIVRSLAGESVTGEPLWKTHAMGRLSGIEAGTQETLLLDEIRARCGRELQRPRATSGGNAELVQVGGRWNSIAEVHIGDGEALARLSLPPEYQDDFDSLSVHPAMLDIATGFAGSINQDKYLPLAYRKVSLHESMQAQGWCHVRRKSSTGETSVFEIRITDDNGKVLIDIGEFVMKRVAELAEQQLRGVPAEAGRMQGVAPSGFAILPDEGVEAIRRLLARELPHQVAVSVVDLNLRIRHTANLEEAAGANPATVEPGRARRRDQHLLAAETDMEAALLAIWQDFFRIDQISMDDNFFDLGGDSLLATQLFSRIQEEFDTELSLSEIFEKPSIRELAAAMEVSKWEQFNAVVPGAGQESERESFEL